MYSTVCKRTHTRVRMCENVAWEGRNGMQHERGGTSSACRLTKRGESASSPLATAFFLNFGSSANSSSAVRRRRDATRRAALGWEWEHVIGK